MRLRPSTLRRYAWLIPVCIIVYATALSWQATEEYFNPDDISNMAIGQIRPYLDLIGSILSVWSNYGRLLGLLYFKVIYDLFGFHVMPFRLGTLIVCALNLVILNALLRRLTNSDAVRYVSLLAASFHGAMWSIYASAGTIFDVLCQTFTLAGLLHYSVTRVRPVNNWNLVHIGLLTSLAIAAKEVGFALPLLLTLYELVIARVQLPGYDRADFRSAVPRLSVSFGVALVAGLGSLSGYDVLSMQAYAPTFTLARFLETTKAHAESVTFKAMILPPSTWIAVLLALLLLALAVRSRLAVFGWLFYNVAVLPLAFSSPRTDGYVLYVAFVGWAIYAGGLLEAAIQRAPRWSGASVAAFALVILGTQLWERTYVPGRFGPGRQKPVRELVEQIRAMYPTFPQGTRILLINDGTGEDRYQPVMILRLAYGDESLQIDKLQWTAEQDPPKQLPPYDHVFKYEDGKYIEIK
jgi:hypothetical protein